MRQGGRLRRVLKISLVLAVLVLIVNFQQTARADNPGPQADSVGLEGTIPSNPPANAATIALPGNNAVFTSTPITISGLCPSGLLIKIFDNGVFVGSTVCVNNSYTLQIDLFSGTNQLVARDYDALDQAGPDSNTITVTFNDAQLLQTGTSLSLTSIYAEKGATPGAELSWPIQLNGGTGPFAISVDWGDGSPQGLLSVATDGTFILTHTYSTAGVYAVVIKAVDKNGQAAFLQLIGQATGAIQSNNKNGSNVIVQKENLLLWPILAMIPLIISSFWLGRRYERRALSNHYLGR
jgi:hypothetical protein